MIFKVHIFFFVPGGAATIRIFKFNTENNILYPYRNYIKFQFVTILKCMLRNLTVKDFNINIFSH
jgi:hypothetical protein